MEKISVVIVDKALDHKGILANASFVIGLSAGKMMSEQSFGEAAVDRDGNLHAALTNQAHFVRKAGQSKIKTLRSKLSSYPEISIVDYTEDAAPSDYQQYLDSIKEHGTEELSYRAIWIYGDRSVVEPLTKNLSSLS